MTTYTELCIDITRGKNVGRAEFLRRVTDCQRHEGKVITGESTPTDPCECGATLYSVDLEFPGTPEFHSFEVCPLCERAYPLIYTYELHKDGKPYRPTDDETYEEYIADMKAAGVGRYILPRSWFDAQQHAFAHSVAPEQDDPEAPEGWFDDDDDDETPSDYPTKTGSARGDWLDEIEAEIEEEQKRRRIANLATAIDKMPRRDFLQLAIVLELMPSATDEQSVKVKRMIDNFAAGKEIYDGVYPPRNT